MVNDEEKKEENRPKLTDKSWQSKNELGDVPVTFHYLVKGGGTESVDAVGKIPPAPVVEDIERNNTKQNTQTGISTMDALKHGRDITCLVFGLDGSELQTLMENKGPDLYNQMKIFAFKLSGTTLSREDIENEKK